EGSGAKLQAYVWASGVGRWALGTARRTTFIGPNAQRLTPNAWIRRLGYRRASFRFGSPTYSGSSGARRGTMKSTYWTRRLRWGGMLAGIALLAGSAVPGAGQPTSASASLPGLAQGGGTLDPVAGTVKE